MLDNGIENEAVSIIGEFGTKYTGNMVDWLDDLIDYLIEIDQRNTFFWCLNPNSGDTGGLLKADWTTEETGKLTALERLQPDPSVITYDADNGRVCISGLGDGTYGTRSPTSPTEQPTKGPSKNPTLKPTKYPSNVNDTAYPTSDPTKEPTELRKYQREPTNEPTNGPSKSPLTSMPSTSPVVIVDDDGSGIERVCGWIGVVFSIVVVGILVN